MQSTHLPGSNLCGVLLPDGTDCPNHAHEDAPLNLCAYHLIQAAAWVRQNDETTRPRELCPLCGQREARRDGDGLFCTQCDFQSLDFTESTYISAAEEEESRPRQYGLRRRSVVYYIQFADRIKIGTTSKHPRERFRHLPHDKVLGFEVGGLATEQERHIQFRADRVRGTEWFAITQPLLDHIAALPFAGTDPWEMYRMLQPHIDTRIEELAD